MRILNILRIAVFSLFFFLAFSSVALTQTVPGQLTLTWVLPTHSTPATGSVPLTGANALTRIDVFISTVLIPDSPTELPTLTLTGSTITGSHTMQVPNGSVLHARIRACNASGCSILTNEVTALVQVDPIPNPPTTITITVVIQFPTP